MQENFEERKDIFENETLKNFFQEELQEKKPRPEISPVPPAPQAQQTEAPVAPPAEAPAKKSQIKKARSRKPSLIEEEPPFNAPAHLFERKGRIFSVINQKGGCGKTTTSINLAAGLAAEGFQVLLIDIDAQANSTLGYGLRLAPDEKTVYHVFRESIYKNPSATPFDLIRKTSVENVSILPSSKFLATLANEILAFKDWEYLLRNYLNNVKTAFHYIVIDCPPALNALTVNALTASDEMIIPLQTHYFSLEGMKELFLTIRSVQEKLNPLLKSGLILPTLYDKRARVNREMLQSIRNYFKDKVLDHVIHMNVRLVESVMHGEPVLNYDPSSMGARDYRGLAREVISKDEAIFDGQSDDRLAKFILQ